jgi:hypothetical protein
MIKKSPNSIQDFFPVTSTSCNKGLTSLKNRDAIWAKIIDSKNYVESYSTMLVKIDDYCDESSRYQMLIPDTRCIDGELFEYQTVKIIRSIPTKSDGFLTINSMTWNKGDNPNDRQKNFHYPDNTPEGGYNHIEVKRYKRAYTLPGVFNVGDPAPPMDEAAKWIKFNYPVGS